MAEIPDYSIDYKSQLENFSQRSQYLGNLIQLVNGSFLPIFLAFFTIAINGHNDLRIPIACVSILFVWRYYIHFIDTEMIDIYRRIIHCQEKIGIFDEEISLKGILKRQIKNKIFYNRGNFFLIFFRV